MFEVIKKQGKLVYAYRLGQEYPVLTDLMIQGKLKNCGDGTYAVLSQEASTGGEGGQIAKVGDYIKIDGSGYPYPNTAAWFEQNHRAIEGDLYEQLPKPLLAWIINEPMCEEIAFLQTNKGLTIDQENFEGCFGAPLWGTWETAARDAVVVFYEITRDVNGAITDIDFNFVARDEFNRSYELHNAK